MSDVVPCRNKIILKNFRPEPLPLIIMLKQLYSTRSPVIAVA